MTAGQGSPGSAGPQQEGPPPTKLLHLVWRLSKGGGIPIVVRALAALDADRFELHVATVRPALADDELQAFGAKAVLHPLGFTGALSPVDRARVTRAFGRRAKRLQPRVVHLHSGTAAYGVLGARRAGRGSVVLDIHAAPGRDQHRRRTEWIEGMLCRRLGWVTLVHSNSVRDDVARSYRLPPGRIHLVPLGIEVQRFESAATPAPDWRQANDLPVDAAICLYVARLVPPKRVDLLIEVASLLSSREAPEIVMAVVGDGPDRRQMEDRVQQAGLERRVRFLGPRYGQDLIDAYHASDVFVSPSDYESFGLSLVEAMAAGLPVVATGVGGVVDVVEDGRTGVVVPQNDGQAMAAALGTLIDDPDRRHRLGSAGRQRARDRFHVSTMVAGYQELYEGLARRPVDVFLLKSPDFTAAQQGSGPRGRLPYAVDHLSGPGVRLRWSDATYRFPWSSRPARRALRAATRLGPPFLQTALNAHHIVRSPVTMAMFESEGNFLAWMRRLRVPGSRATRLMVIACWLSELLPSFTPRRLRWYQRTYAAVDRLLFFSSNQFGVFQDLLHMPQERLRFVPFGVDHEVFTPSSADDGFVLAVGRDRGRDWPTFLDAMSTTGLPTKVLCRPADVAGLPVPDNVEVLGFVDAATYRELLGRARLSVVASRPVAYPAGQSVVLESMASAKCCVVTGTDSLRDYLDDGVNALVVPVADPAALADSVCRAFDDGAVRARIGAGGRQSVEERFNARAMWAAVRAEIDDLMG